MGSVNGIGSGDRTFLRPRTAILATLVAALVVAIVILKGSERPDDPGSSTEIRQAPRVDPDRPAGARPVDPRKRSEDQRPPPPRPPAGPDTRPRASIAVRVVDSDGQLRAGIPVELRSSDLGRNPGRLLDAVRFSDQQGSLHFPWPKAAGTKDVLVSPGMILEEPLVVPVPSMSAEPVTIRIPESGEVSVLVVDSEGRPFDGGVTVLLLVATNDPWPEAAALTRASRPAAAGRARIPLVESGTLLLVEGRAVDSGWKIAPKLVEGPAREGALVETSIVVRRRDSAESAPSTRPRFVPADKGPATAAGQPGAREGTVRVTVRPKEALPQWPLAMEVSLRRSPGGAIEHATRADARGAASFTAPAGRFSASCRLWRVMPDGWVTADVDLVVPGQPLVVVAAGRQQSVEIMVDPRALASTAAALAGW